MDDDPRIKLDAFQGETIFQNDYRKFIPDKRDKYVWPKDRSERPEKKSAEFHRIDPETFLPWKKHVYIPFDIMVKPRPIIDTRPTDLIPRNPKPIDEGKENAIKTRPRLYMAPAVSIDDIPDPSMREIICNYMYSTEFKKSAEEAASSNTVREIAKSTLDFGGDPIKLRTNVFPALPIGWREKGKAWDSKQKRALVDSTETFWLRRGLEIKCGACTDPYKGAVLQETKDEIATLISKDELRIAHDYLPPGYAGVKPEHAGDLPLSKSRLPVEHPFLSTSQAITTRYLDDNN